MELFHKHDKNKNGKLSKEEFQEFEKELLRNEIQGSLVEQIAERNFRNITQGKKDEITTHDFLKHYQDIFGEERSQVAEILQESCPAISTGDLNEALKLFEKYDLDVKIIRFLFLFHSDCCYCCCFFVNVFASNDI